MFGGANFLTPTPFQPPKRLWERRGLIAALILVSMTAGCRDRAVETLDLLRLARYGQWRVERSRIPTDREEVPELGKGWTRSRNAPGGQHFHWASDSVSTVNLLCVEPRDLELHMTVRPFTWPGSPPQSVAITLNGNELGSWKILQPTALRIPLVEKYVVPGMNSIHFSWAYAQKVSDVLPRKSRSRRAAAITDLVVAGLPDRIATDHPVSSEDGLSLQPGSELRIAVWAERGSRLEVELDPNSEAGLQIWTKREGEDLSLQWTSNRREDNARIPLGDRNGPIEIVFRARRSATDASRTVQSARIVQPSDSTPQTGSSTTAVTQPDILLYVVDTLRADRLSCYGGPPGISPALDRLASDGVLFENAVAQSSWTKPSMVSVLSGMLTTEHGVRQREPQIPKQVALVAEVLQSAGYRTGAFTANAYLVEAAGFDRGFDTFRYAHEISDSMSRQAVDWLGEVGNERPVFLWVHTIDPHAPYEPEQPYRERWAPDVAEGVGSVDHIRSLAGRPSTTRKGFKDDFLALYDAEVAQNDASFGLIVDWMRERKRYRDAMVVFLSDHGEEFWEHGVNGHGWDLFEEVLHVPMVIKPAGQESAGVRRRDVAEHVDLVPTLLTAAGLKTPETLRGRDLLAETPVNQRERVAFSEMTYEGREGLTVRWREMKLIVPISRNFLSHPQLFNLENDPHELQPITDLPVTAAWLAQEGRRHFACLSSAPSVGAPVAMDEETRKGLEALGYLDPEESEDE
ncbi:MAG: sulfatase [Acidobacteria bacterium]|nr:sulfatase [Candidatus Sulfomarinibacter kjeldsenii]